MRAVFLKTGTNETDKYCESIKSVGFEYSTLTYDTPGRSDSVLFGELQEAKPDLVVYIGSRWGPQPSIAILAAINERIAPSVHLCSDAADQPWWDLLREYHLGSAFSLQVAIDGSHKFPVADACMVALTPVDPSLFQACPKHADRPFAGGYAGNPGGGYGSKRTGMLSALLQRSVIDQLHIRSNLPHTNEMYCRFLQQCRMSINIAWTGTETSLHVKGRVLESGLAGCCLLETRGAPSSYWFRPGLDYLEYGSPDEAANIIRRLLHEPEATQAMGISLRNRIITQHTPRHFWERILERIGLAVAV